MVLDREGNQILLEVPVVRQEKEDKADHCVHSRPDGRVNLILCHQDARFVAEVFLEFYLQLKVVEH